VLDISPISRAIDGILLTRLRDSTVDADVICFVVLSIPAGAVEGSFFKEEENEESNAPFEVYMRYDIKSQY
jgi:hypothetical protein